RVSSCVLPSMSRTSDVVLLPEHVIGVPFALGEGKEESVVLSRFDCRSVWWRPGQGQREAHGRTTTGPVFSPDAPAVRFHHATANRQPQSGTAGHRVALHPVKFLEDALLSAGWQPWPLVRYLDGDRAVCRPGRQRNGAARWRVLHGIVQQVDQHL